MTPHAGRVVARLLLAASSLVGTATGAQAQMPVPGGTGVTGMRSPAVFGGARREQPGTNHLSLGGNVLGGYDTNVLADSGGLETGTGGGLGSLDQTTSSLAGGSVQLSWSQNRNRVSYFGSAGASYRKFFDISDFDARSYDAAGGMSVQLTARSSLSVNANVTVQPFYQFGVLGGGFAGGLQPATGVSSAGFVPDYQGAREQVLRFGGFAGYDYQLSQRTTFSAYATRFGSRPVNDNADRAGLSDLGTTYVGARLTRRLTTNLGARLGYGYSWFDTVDTQPLLDDAGQESTSMHNIDVGLDYSKALSFARRTSFSFGTGTNIWRSTGGSNIASDGQTQFNIIGFATLQRQFFRTWSASLNYTRGTSYVEGYNEFMAYDTATASIVGLFTDRLDAGASVSYTSGGYLSVRGERVSNFGGGAQLQYGLTQNLAAFVAYTYTWLDVPGLPVAEPHRVLPPGPSGRAGGTHSVGRPASLR